MKTLERVPQSAVRWNCPDCHWTATDLNSRRLRLAEVVSTHVTKHIIEDDPSDTQSEGAK